MRDGKLAGPEAGEVIAILTESTPVKDPAVWRAAVPHGCNPDGKVSRESLEKDLRFFKDRSW